MKEMTCPSCFQFFKAVLPEGEELKSGPVVCGDCSEVLWLEPDGTLRQPRLEEMLKVPDSQMFQLDKFQKLVRRYRPGEKFFAPSKPQIEPEDEPNKQT